MKEYKVVDKNVKELQLTKWYKKGQWIDRNELMLRKSTKKSQQEILAKERREKLPILIVIDGVDGVGKTNVVENVRKQIKEDYKEECIFNTFKRRREDKE